MHASDIRHGLERTFSVNAAFSSRISHPWTRTSTARSSAHRNAWRPRGRATSAAGSWWTTRPGRSRFICDTPIPTSSRNSRCHPRWRCPPNVPRHDSGLHPVPATGPYMITHYDIRHAVLERNPYFHEWSPDAQPDGYPDRIVWRVFKKTSQAVSAVEHGTADWLYFTLQAAHSRSMRSRPTTPPRPTHPPTPPPTARYCTELAVGSRSPRAARDRIRHRPATGSTVS